jgi:3-deoxy-D-manno-octulosonic-acid transferase
MGLLPGLALYNILSTMAALPALPFLLAACLTGSAKWRERCGQTPRLRGPAVWVHAASVGEVMMIRPLLAEIRSRWPDKPVALSTMTGTGREAARLVLGESGRAFFFPLDLWWAQLRALGRIKPGMVLVCETELWPNLMWLCGLKGIPLFLVNARLSERSLPWYRALRFLFGPLLARAALIACQSQADADRFRSLAGVNANIMVAGNLKHDVMAGPPAKEGKSVLREALGIASDDLVLVAGSTREGEEEAVLEAWQGALGKSKIKNQKSKLIIAPRHPDRFVKVAGILKENGLEFARRSLKDKLSEARRIMLWDTLGELTTAYAAGDMAFVGGSLAPVGGHNPLEPAGLGLPVIFGPHMFNAAESARCLLEGGGAAQVGSAEELRTVLTGWMEDHGSRRDAGNRARQAVESGRGAVRLTAEEMERALRA